MVLASGPASIFLETRVDFGADPIASGGVVQPA
jgi:hypothetical protein